MTEQQAATIIERIKEKMPDLMPVTNAPDRLMLGPIDGTQIDIPCRVWSRTYITWIMEIIGENCLFAIHPNNAEQPWDVKVILSIYSY